MQPTEISADELARLAVLHSYGLVDSPGHPALDHLAALAARLFVAPIALITLIDRDKQLIKARVGTDLTETDRALSFCTHTIREDRVMVVPDATLDERFSRNPLVVDEPRIRFYAGAPLIAPTGHRLGVLCIIDTAPKRYFGAQGEAILRDLAAVAVDAMELMRRQA